MGSPQEEKAQPGGGAERTGGSWGGVSGQADFQVQLWGSPGKCSSQHWEGLVFSEQGGVDALCQTLTCLLSP